MSDAIVRSRSHQTILDCFDEDMPPNPLGLALGELSETGIATTTLTSKRHVGSHLTVLSQLSVGIDQRLRIGWVAPIDMLNQGYRVLGFRRTDGFAKYRSVEDLSLHGVKIIDAAHCDVRDEIVTPGEYFYTFVFVKTGWFLSHEADVVQFSERIPSGEHVINRLRETVEAQKLVQELLKLNGAKGRSNGGGTNREPLSGKSIAALLAEQHQEIQELRQSEAFASLPQKEQEYAIAAIKHQYKQRMQR